MYNTLSISNHITIWLSTNYWLNHIKNTFKHIILNTITQYYKMIIENDKNGKIF